jgi:hypothetical protein
MLLLGVLLTATLLFSHFGLFGDFRWRVFGVPHHFMWDPGGPYMTSGAYLFRTGKFAFVGHPGIFLQFLIACAAEGSYGLARVFGTPPDYSRYLARNWYSLVLLMKLLTAALHVLSFWLLARLGRRFHPDGVSDRGVALACATAYPFLVYLNNVSGEPILHCLVLAAILLAWKHFEARAERRPVAAWAFLVASGIAAAAGCYSKMMLAAPAALGLLLYLLIERPPEERRPSTRRVLVGAVFVASLAALAAALSLVVHWKRFFTLWSMYSGAECAMGGAEAAPMGLWATLTACCGLIADKVGPMFAWEYWLPGPTPMGLFWLAEGPFVLIALVGTVLMLRNPHIDRRKLVGLLLIGLMILPVALFRREWHYYMILQALGCIPFCYALRASVARLRTGEATKPAGLAVMAILIALVHFPSIALSVEGKFSDIDTYRRRSAAFFSALRRVDPDRRVALLGYRAPKNPRQPGAEHRALGICYGSDPPELREAIRSYFVYLPVGTPASVPSDVDWIIERTGKGASERAVLRPASEAR